MTCSARSFSSASSSSAIARSSSASPPRGRVPAIGRVVARPPGDGHERLRRRADDLEVLEVEEVHVRRGVDRAQPAVDRERVDGHLRGPALGRDHLEGVARVDVLDDPRHHRLVRLARHVRLEARLGARGVGGRAAARERAGEPLAHLREDAERALVAGVDPLLLHVGVGEDGDRVLEVVEGHERVREHQRQVGEADRVRVGLGEPLDRAHAVVAEEAHGAARERRQAGQRRLAVAGDGLRGERVRDRRRRPGASAGRRAGGSR